MPICHVIFKKKTFESSYCSLKGDMQRFFTKLMKSSF